MSEARLRQRVGRRIRVRLAPQLEWAFDRRVLALALRRRHVLCIGDSHVKVMNDVRVPRSWFRVTSVKGASATGIRDPGSATGARGIFDRRLRRARPWQHLLVLLGEVDCGCAIWRRARREGLDPHAQMELTLDSYTSFLEVLSQRGFAHVHVLSVPLPTIDVPVPGDVSGDRLDVPADQRERTRLTLAFNEALAVRCRALGVSFVDISDGLLDPATQLIRQEFVKRPQVNQHLVREPYARLISARLAEHFERLAPSPRHPPAPDPASRGLSTSRAPEL